MFAKVPMQHWRQVFDKAHITYGAILESTEAVNDPQFLANNIVVPLEGAGGELRDTVNSPRQVHGVPKNPHAAHRAGRAQ